jgi:hypothetical protein
VDALLLRWEEDDLQVQAEIEDLQSLLRDIYGFSTETYLIPTKGSHVKLMSKVLSFVEEHESGESLLIVYYGGHGLINKARQSTWSW